MCNIGDTVRISIQNGSYEIIASKENPRTSAAGGTIPPQGSDFALKRVDGHMTSDFEPYIYVNESMIIRD